MGELTTTSTAPRGAWRSMLAADRMVRLTALRIAVIGAIGVVLALAAGDIFDRTLWRLLPAAILPPMAAVLTIGRGTLARVTLGAVSIGLAVAVAVVATGGSVGDAIDAVSSGPRRMLSAEWPSPLRPDLVGSVAAAIAVSSAVAADLARRPRWHLLPLLAPAVPAVGVIAMSAPLGARLGWLLPLGLLMIGFATLRRDAAADQLSLLRGERRLVPLAIVTVVVAGAASVPIAIGPRADPRYTDPPAVTAPLLDPIEAMLALRAIDPPIALHEISAPDGTVLPRRWRTAAMAEYDGQRWTPDLVLRPIGRRLGPASETVIDVTVSFLDDDLSLVPLPGAAVTVDAPIETDEERTIVRLLERPEPGAEIPVSANVAPIADRETGVQLATRPVDESVSGLSEIARTLGGGTAGGDGSGGTVMEQLRSIERTMRDEFLLESGAPGGGMQRTLVERFLRDTRRGNAEQFATSFVLLARALGVDARVATGFEVAGDAGGAALVLRSSDASIWPEVRLVDGRWMAFDPVPSEEISGATEAPPEPQVQTPAAPQPPVVPPPDPSDETPPTDDAADRAGRGPLPTAIVWLIRGSALAGVLLVPVLLVVGAILGVKRRRRRRRVRAPEPVDRIRGMWAVATDALVDAGLAIEPSATDREIASDGEPLAPAAGPQLRRLATMSSAVTFGAPAGLDQLVDDAGSCLEHVETSLSRSFTRWQRLRWRLSSRSLRRSTRSPVAP